ncbi:serine/threonine protein kinase [Streptomyces triticagri]|uniref:non-specific serine/threonine protein kinase n=1 Tax=Streptomyces triticagri TaxID=2293568 RepID=A0A372LVD3_9ACTN|nr:serine/threonine-protein kinase [Streptomyces triticagri]RFU82634.1 serine/threonine protein kinase [Streptomyces triticagri]
MERIGRGGMGTVWQAEDEVLGRHVAVKKLHLPGSLEDTERARLFERTRREARSAARITHPNVVVVHDVVDDDGLPCIIMEHVRGSALDEILKKNGPLTAPEAARVGAGMVAALRAAHGAEVLHRDVKPGNVLLGADGRVVLTDFGIAVVADTSTLTRTGELVGSIDFLAPERLRGGDPAPASDLWALGATLYQAVQGYPPFRRNTPFETAYAIAFDAVEPPADAQALAPLIDELLAKDPAERPSAAQVEERLRELTSTTAVQTVRHLPPDPARTAPTAPMAQAPGTPTPGGPGGGRGRGRRVVLWAAVTTVAVALAVGGTFLLMQGRGDDKDSPPQGGPEPTRSAERTPTAEPSPVPQGYRLVHEKQFGVSFPVPEGWTRKDLPEDNEGVAYIDPAGLVSLRVATVDLASTDPLQRWKDDEARSIEEGKLPGYRQIRMQSTAYRGMPAAIWEFTWQGRARQFRAQDLGFGEPGKTEYAIYLSAPSADWNRHKKVFADVRNGFRFDKGSRD